MPAASRPIVAIAAMELEVKPLLKGLKKLDVDGFKVYQGILEGQSLLVLISGVGLDNARRATAWVITQNPKKIVSLGFAGGLSKALSSGDLLMSCDVRNFEGNRIACEAFGAQSQQKGTLLTMNSVVQFPDEKKALAPLADGVDMESYAVAEVASKAGISFSSLRIISDSSEDAIPIDFSLAFSEDKFSPLKAIFLILKKPSSIPSIFALAYRSNVYAERLCKVFMKNFT